MTLGCLLKKKKWSQRWIVRILVPLPISFRNILYLMRVSVYHCRSTMWKCSKNKCALLATKPQGHAHWSWHWCRSSPGPQTPTGLPAEKASRTDFLWEELSTKRCKMFPPKGKGRRNGASPSETPRRKLQLSSLLQACGKGGLCSGACPPLIWRHCPSFLGERGSVGRTKMMLNVHRRGALLR